MRGVPQSKKIVSFLELVGERRDRETVAGRDIADDRVDVLALDEVAVLGDLLGRAAGLVHDHHLDRSSVDALLVVGRAAACRH